MAQGSEPQLYWNAPHNGAERALTPDTGEVIHGNSTGDTFKKWLRYVKERGIEPPNAWAVFNDCACRALKPELRSQRCAIVDDNAPEPIRRERIIGFQDIMDFFAKVKGWFKSDETVDQQEADRRATICAMCPRNIPASIGGCPSCTGVFSKMAAGLFELIGDRRTVQGDRLQHCGVCSCNLRALVWVPLSVLKEHGNPEHQFPEWCWQSGT